MNAFRIVFAAAAFTFCSSFLAFAQDAPAPVVSETSDSATSADAQSSAEVPAIPPAPSTWEEVLKAGGVRIVSKASRGDRTVYTLASGQVQFTVDAAGPVGPETAKAVLALGTAISGWKSLVPASISFTAIGDDVRLRVLPATFAEGSRNFMPYVPSGLVFSSMGGFIDYEFRVKVDAYFLRFRGRFAGERDLLDRLVSAIDDPAGFVKNNDPDYHMARTIEQEELIIALTARLDELEKRLAAEDARIALLETASIAVMGKAGSKPVDPALVDRVTALHKENPSVTAKDIYATLKSEGVKTVNLRQVQAVLASLFGEY